MHCSIAVTARADRLMGLRVETTTLALTFVPFLMASMAW